MTTMIAVIVAVVMTAVAMLSIMRTLNILNGKSSDSMKSMFEAMDRAQRERAEVMMREQEYRLRHLAEKQSSELAAHTELWQTRLEEADLRSRETFAAVSQQTLNSSVDHLQSGNARQIETLLTPMRMRLEELTRLIHEVEVSRVGSQEALRERMDRLAELNTTLGQEAHALTQALRGNNKVQGDWGETILKTLLEKAGLEEGVNFRAQAGSDTQGQSFRSEQGRLLRPDVIIDLPDGRHMIVDSKVSLTDYVRYCECDPADEHRDSLGRRHVESVKRHINELAAKKYQKVVEGAMEHVLMFIPNEGAYLTALSIDSDLWQYAFERNVAMVSPAHLLSTIQIVSQLWREHRQDRNSAEIARVAGLIHDSLLDFATRLDKVGAALETTRRTYDETRRMLDKDNPKSLTRRAARLREMGAKTHRSQST